MFHRSSNSGQSFYLSPCLAWDQASEQNTFTYVHVRLFSNQVNLYSIPNDYGVSTCTHNYYLFIYLCEEMIEETLQAIYDDAGEKKHW